MQAGKYAKAKESFTKMLSSAPPDLAERIRMYISACLLQISKGTTTFESHEERYDYAISLLNEGHYEDAREHFKSILKENPSADYVFYGLAVLASITGDSHVCLEHPCRSLPTQSLAPHPGPRRLRLSRHGGRPSIHRTALPRGLRLHAGGPSTP